MSHEADCIRSLVPYDLEKLRGSVHLGEKALSKKLNKIIFILLMKYKLKYIFSLLHSITFG